MKLRPQVQAFAEAMEKKLRENDHKGGWKDVCGCTTGYLTRRLRTELRELVTEIGKTNRAYTKYGQGRYGLERDQLAARKKLDGQRAKLLGEAADVANFAMMIADVMDALEKK